MYQSPLTLVIHLVKIDIPPHTHTSNPLRRTQSVLQRQFLRFQSKLLSAQGNQPSLLLQGSSFFRCEGSAAFLRRCVATGTTASNLKSVSRMLPLHTTHYQRKVFASGRLTIGSSSVTFPTVVRSGSVIWPTCLGKYHALVLEKKRSYNREPFCSIVDRIENTEGPSASLHLRRGVAIFA